MIMELSTGVTPIKLPTRRAIKRSEVIARDLAQFIMDENLPDGAKLPQEQEMVQQLGVGRTTLREALRILESRGVITMRSGPGGGPIVRHPKPSDLTDSLLLVMQFQHATMRHVFDARASLEAASAGLAATRIGAEQIARLREINAQIAATDVAQHEHIGDLNVELHTIIAVATGNIVVQTLIETLLAIDAAIDTDTIDTDEFKDGIVHAHSEVIDALAAGDSDSARKAMQHHLEFGMQQRNMDDPSLMSQQLRWTQ
jgi:GntR family transcriptional repressor for pyruvate dehydrogenase complex